MADTKSYTYEIAPNGDGSHSVSPGWMLVIIRFTNPSKYETPTTRAAFDTNIGEIIINDCISLNVANSKEGMNPGMSAVLKMTDRNWPSIISPGDFVFVNMFNHQTKAKELKTRARQLLPINRRDDGFKGIYRIETVTRNLSTNPMGVKTYTCNIQASAFREFANKMLFNTFLFQDQKENENLWNAFISKKIRSTGGHVRGRNVQSLVKVLIEMMLGGGPRNIGERVQDVSYNSHFRIPTIIGKLLGIKQSGKLYAHKVYNYLFGIQEYGTGRGSNQKNKKQNRIPNISGGVAQAKAERQIEMEVGMNPRLRYGTASNTHYCPKSVSGYTVLLPDYWNSVESWSILQQYANLTINELYTTFRMNPTGSVMPTLVLRQIPFTSEDFDAPNKLDGVTKFLNLPRWKVDPELIYSMELGKDEKGRINFVQVFTSIPGAEKNASMAAQIAAKNYQTDLYDVQRHGLRPMVKTAPYDYPLKNADNFLEFFSGPAWAKLLADFYIDGQLKENGTVIMQGIEEPISVGDNFQIGNMVYHIENVTHQGNIDAMGYKTFRTSVGLSMGIDIRSNRSRQHYIQNDALSSYPRNAYDARKVAHEEEGTLIPGIGEEQDILIGEDNENEGSSIGKVGPDNLILPGPRRP